MYYNIEFRNTSVTNRGRLIFLLISLLYSSLAYSQNDESWSFIITPVLWNASVDVKGSGDGSGGDLAPDYSFFTIDNLNDYLSLKFEANHGRYGLLFDSLRAGYEDKTDRKIVNVVASSKLGFIELDARYQITGSHKLDLIGGVRRSFLDIDLTLGTNRPTATPRTASSEDVWTDPIIGLRYQHPFSENWLGLVRGDLGGFNVGTRWMYNFTADIRYRFNNYVSLALGYRYLKLDFKDDDILDEVTLDGFQLGLGIHF